MPDIDWQRASRRERQILYRYLKAEMDTWNLTLHQMLKEAVGLVNVGLGYDANMRSGRFSRKYANQLYDWLKNRNAGYAESVLNQVLHLRQYEAKGAWGELVRHNHGGLKIIEYPERQNIFTFAETDRTFSKIARGTPYFFRLTCPSKGFAIGFQQMNSLWYRLPLSREGGWVPVKKESNDLPCSVDGSIEPLMEESDTGMARFVAIFAHQKIEFGYAAEPGVALSRQTLDKFAGALVQDPPPIAFSIRVLIT